jgi:hypothetical protein
MKKISTLILLLISISLFAKEVPRETAIKAATFFYKERCANMGVKLASDPTVKSVYAEMSNNNALYYIINYDKGFVVIAAIDASTPILGYSLDQQLDKSNTSPALTDWFTMYEESLKAAIKTNAKAAPEAKAEWERITDPNAVVKVAKTGTPVVLPLLTSTWNQDQYYNERCPFDSMSVSGYDWHVPNGCVALSTAQAMYYNRYPLIGTGSRGYTHPTYGYQYANFATTTYDWNAMTDVVSNYNYNVAQLIYHVGVSVMMDYAVDGSGSQTTLAAQSLKQYFGYSNNVSAKDKMNYSDAQWVTLFKGQLDAKHVMINSGSTAASGGHAFNCDGYDDQDYFHFNFGWAGYGNGYYLLTSLTPTGSDFSQNQQAVINVYPQNTPSSCVPGTVLTARNGSLEDGSRSAQYTNNFDCQWLIAPDEATSISITFSRIATELNADSVVFYAGETTSDPQIASFSGTTLPGTFTIDSPKVLVRFITNSSVVNEGWLLNYSSAVAGTSYCTSAKVYTTATGTVADGSATSKYHNNTYCKWFIQPSGAANITLTFTEFDLATDDQLYVLNRTNTTNSSLIKVLTGSALPSVIYCPSGKLGLIFQADNKNIANGFSANWTSSTTGVNEINGVENIALYPNPASSSLNIEMKLDRNFAGSINILDASGRLVYTSNVKSDAGTFNHQVDVSNLSAGFYLVNFNDEQGQRISMKFSKQ